MTEDGEGTGLVARNNNTATERTAQWRGTGGNALRIDYIFKKVGGSPGGSWSVAYKKASTLCSNADCPFYEAPSPVNPTVFNHRLWEQLRTGDNPVVRISYFAAVNTDDIARVLNSIVAGYPDAVYMNVGAWMQAQECDAGLITDLVAARPQTTFVWGTLTGGHLVDPNSGISRCDGNVLGNFTLLGSGLVPCHESWEENCFINRNNVYNELKRTMPYSPAGEHFLMIGPGDINLTPHLSYGGATHDYMRLVNFLVKEKKKGPNEGVIKFDDKCWMDMFDVRRFYGKEKSSEPYQGWKNPWKLACDFAL